MEGKVACSNYQVDMTAAEFGACKHCGLKKFAHNAQTTNVPSKGFEGSLKDKVKMFSQGNNNAPSPAINLSTKKTVEVKRKLTKKLISIILYNKLFKPKMLLIKKHKRKNQS